MLLPPTAQLVVVHAGDHDRDVARALADAGRSTARPGPPALEGRALIRVAGDHGQGVGVVAVVVAGVGDRRGEHLADVAGDVAVGERQDLVGVGHVEAADQVEHLTGLVGGYADELRLGAGARSLVGLEAGHRSASLASGLTVRPSALR